MHYLAYQTIIQHLKEQNIDLPMATKKDLKSLKSDDFSGDLAKMLNLQNEFLESNEYLLPDRAKKKNQLSKSLLIIGDSFNGSMEGYWPYSFLEHRFKHHNRGNIKLSSIINEKPDVVILQMVERFLQCQLIIIDSSDTKESCRPFSVE